MTAAICPAYFPPIDYIAWVLKQNKVVLNKDFFYQKQTFRNRTSIYSPNGKQDLIVPIRHTQHKQTDGEIKIAYDEDWQKNHWKSITTAYNASPFFEFYKEELEPLFLKKHETLYSLNKKILLLVFGLLDVASPLVEEKNYILNTELVIAKRPPIYPIPQYTQVFKVKHGFIPNLSILDLIFNLGNEAKGFLEKGN